MTNKKMMMATLVEWLKETARINDAVSDNWKEEDLNDYRTWMLNGVQECLECSEEEAEFIKENDDFFVIAVFTAAAKKSSFSFMNSASSSEHSKHSFTLLGIHVL